MVPGFTPEGTSPQEKFVSLSAGSTGMRVVNKSDGQPKSSD